MRKRSSKARSARVDVNQRAYATMLAATEQAPADEPVKPEAPPKNPAAVALGRLGGAKGGKARAKALSKKRRSEIAKKAARARWSAKRSRG